MKKFTVDSKGNFTFSQLLEAYRLISKTPLSFRGLRHNLLKIEHHQKRKVLKIIRKKREADGRITDEDILLGLSQVLFVAVEVAFHIGVNLQQEMSLNYPGYCRYCSLTPCRCRVLPPHKKPRRKMLEIPPHWWSTMTVQGMQEIEWKIYPKALSSEEVLETLCHLYEEIGELAIELDPESESEIDFVHVSQEVCDVVDKTLNLANIIEKRISTTGVFVRGVAILFNHKLKKSRAVV